MVPRTEIDLKAGYGFDERHAQFLIGAKYRLWQKQKLDFGSEYSQGVVNRPVQPAAWQNPTFDVLTSKYDPFDYYFEKGFKTFITARPLSRTTLSLTYNNFRQSSLDVNTDFSIFNRDGKHRSNPGITDGRLRSLSPELAFDSRKLTKLKGKDVTSGQTQYSMLRLGAEFASPRLLGGDFDFRRYYLYLFRRQRLLGLGVSSVTLYGGLSEGQLPPQRYYQIISGSGAVSGRGSFRTVAEQGFVGDRLLSAFIDHNFRQILFRKSRLPLIKKIPFTLSVHGGVFWTEFSHVSPAPAFKSAPSMYSEIGFGIGNLTPFLSLFNVQLHFSWQLSHYNGNRFIISWGFGY